MGELRGRDVKNKEEQPASVVEQKPMNLEREREREREREGGGGREVGM